MPRTENSNDFTLRHYFIFIYLLVNSSIPFNGDISGEIKIVISLFLGETPRPVLVHITSREFEQIRIRQLPPILFLFTHISHIFVYRLLSRKHVQCYLRKEA